MSDNKVFEPVGTQLNISLASANVNVDEQLDSGIDAFVVMVSGGAAEYRMDGGDPTSTTNLVLAVDDPVLVRDRGTWQMVFKQASGVTLVIQPGRMV